MQQSKIIILIVNPLTSILYFEQYVRLEILQNGLSHNQNT